MNRVFIYTRVSTQEQATEGYSLGEQEERLKKYAEAMGWTVAQVFVDGGFSGGNINRPAMQSMIKAIKRHETDIVLVDKLDRLSRSQFDTLYLIQEVFTKNNVAFVSRAEAFDTSSAFGRAMVGILAVFAELERERIKERMKDGIEGRAKEGKWKGGRIPTGYDYDPKSGKLVINPYEAEQVRIVIDMFHRRIPIHNIMQRMNASGYRTKYGEWTEGTVRNVVTSRLYRGDMSWKGDWIPSHEPIITEEEWKRSQVILNERKKQFENYRPGRRYASPLAGLIRCGVCGAKYHCRTASPNKNGTPRRYYMCYSRAGTDKKLVIDPNCKNKNYRDRDLEAIIYAEVRKLKSEPLYIDQLRDSVNHQSIIDEAEKRIIVIDKQISKMMDLYSIGSLDIEIVKNKVNALSEEKKALDAEIEAHKAAIMVQLPKSDIHELVSMFEAAVQANDTAEINNVLSEIIEFIEIEYENIKIRWRF